MNRYNIYWVDLNPTKGSEINKVRPCVIISPDELNEHLNTIVIAPLTTVIRTHYPFRLSVKVAGKDGQIAVDQLRTIDKSRLKDLIGVLSQEDAEALRDLIHRMYCIE